MRGVLLIALALFAAGPAFAQGTAPCAVRNVGGQYVICTPVYTVDPSTGIYTPGGGGGGGAATIADGADVAQGSRGDAAWLGSGNATVISTLKTIASAALDTTTASPITAAQLPASLGSKSAASSLATTNPKSATSTSANVSAANSSTLVLASNANRNGCNVINDSTAVAYLKLGTGASATSFDYYMAGSVNGIPASFSCPTDWVGPIYIFWVSATGAARVSERTN